MSLELIFPEWPAAQNVRALVTTRQSGVSRSPWASFNLATHVGDDATAVAANRAALRGLLPAEPRWLEQVHGTRCVDAAHVVLPVAADASFATQAGVVCTVMTADCLPVFFCNRAGTVVAAAHAGWRGLLAGVLENTLAAMNCTPDQVIAWLGPAIGPAAFEVGAEVRDAFLAHDAACGHAFALNGQKTGHSPDPLLGGYGSAQLRSSTVGQETWLCDLYALARQRLQQAGIVAVYGGGLCTFSDRARFYSYRRDGTTGRMASLIWRV